ncbi:hypothetical protein PIB30_039429 [Stylosanthes scabra]|uniref:DUF4216 domain-containing protein n=1 Tax=Stylosanthes scabra TaxID=79078 RepID=A0ABU6SEK7_9FABA|nr:hypothetical protein [Stylosanthes scabra]
MCEWYDSARLRGTRTHKDYQITEANHSRIYDQFDPFILAQNDEAYQNVDEIPVTLIIETEIHETLRSPTGEMDIVNTQVDRGRGRGIKAGVDEVVGVGLERGPAFPSTSERRGWNLYSA